MEAEGPERSRSDSFRFCGGGFVSQSPTLSFALKADQSFTNKQSDSPTALITIFADFFA